MPTKPSWYRCERCGLMIEGWPCLTAADARECQIAKDEGIKPKLKLKRK